MLTSSALQVHYEPTQSLVHLCDASQYGIGAVLPQVWDSDEKPVVYAFRTLTNKLQPARKWFSFNFWSEEISQLRSHLVKHSPYAQTTSLYRDALMTPNRFLLWHQPIQRGIYICIL